MTVFPSVFWDSLLLGPLGPWVALLLLEVRALSLEPWNESLSKEALLDCS